MLRRPCSLIVTNNKERNGETFKGSSCVVMSENTENQNVIHDLLMECDVEGQ